MAPFVVGESFGPFWITRHKGVAGKPMALQRCRRVGGDLKEGRAECELAVRLEAQVLKGHLSTGLCLAQTGETERARLSRRAGKEATR